MLSMSRVFRMNSYRQAGRLLRHGWRVGKLSYLRMRSGLGDSAWALYGLARATKPEVCVEIGSALGRSACFVGMALDENRKGKLFAIDPHSQTDWNDENAVDSYEAMRKNLRFVGVSHRVEIIRKLSADAAKGWNRPIDLIFIDGDHSYEGVRADWELFLPHMSPFGLVAFHDSIWEVGKVDESIRRGDMGVPRLVDELRREGYPVVTLPMDYGLSIVQARKNGVPLMQLGAQQA